MAVKLVKDMTKEEKKALVIEILKSDNIDPDVILKNTFEQLSKLDDIVTKKDLETLSNSIKEDIAKMDKAIADLKTPTEKDTRNDGYKCFAEFVNEVIQYSETRSYEGLNRLKSIHEKSDGVHKVAGPAAGSASTGGTLIPTAFIQQPLIQELGSSGLWARCTSLPMSALKTEIPVFETGSQANLTFYGGIRFYKPAEAGAITEQTFLSENIGIELHTLAAATSPTGIMLRHSPISIEALLKTMFSKGLQYVLDRNVIAGSGANEPLGILNSKAKITVDAISGQGTNTFIWENARDMKARMPWSSRINSVWVIQPDAMPQLEGMYIPAGFGGIPVFMPASGVSGQQFDTLYNRPIIESESCPALGTEGDVILFDPTMYIAAYFTGGEMWDLSPHVYFLYDRETLRLLYERGGRCWWSGPRTPENGLTKSPIVTLNSTRT